MKREGKSQWNGGEEDGKKTNVDVSGAVRVAIHHLQQLPGLCVVGRVNTEKWQQRSTKIRSIRRSRKEWGKASASSK
jgi:hypothetical protein